MTHHAREKIDLHAADGCAHLTGFNYQPSWGHNGLTVWGDSFDDGRYAAELTRGKTFFPKFNVVRIWLSWSAFRQDATRFLRNFNRAIDICGELDLLVIPVLFTRWVGDPPFDPVRDSDLVGTNHQETFGPYIEAVLRHQTGNKTILAWDLCNEPETHAETPQWLDLDPAAFQAFHRYHVSQPAGAAQDQWLRYIHDQIRSRDPGALICFGTLFDYGIGALQEPMSDILTPHLYGMPPYELVRKVRPDLPFQTFFENMVSDYAAFARKVGKPVISTETCWPPGFNADSQARVACMHQTLGLLKRHGMGFAAHALYASGVADLHDPASGLGGAYMGFINLDGTLRQGHEAFNQYC